jgi:hypothetical protein
MRWGRRKKCCDVGCCGVVVLIRRVFRCVRSWDDYSVGTSRHGEWFEGSERIVYKERLLVLEDFLFFSLYSFSCIANNSTTLITSSISVPVFVSRYAFRVQPSNIHITCARPRPLQFSWSGRERVAFFLVYKGGQYAQYASRWPSLWLITWLTRPKVVEALLTLSFRIGQGAYRFLFCL